MYHYCMEHVTIAQTCPFHNMIQIALYATFAYVHRQYTLQHHTHCQRKIIQRMADPLHDGAPLCHAHCFASVYVYTCGTLVYTVTCCSCTTHLVHYIGSE